MAPPKKQTTGTIKTSLGSYSGKSRPITGFFFLVIGVLLLISLLIFDLDNSSFKKVPFGLPPAQNASNEFVVGVFGEYIAFGSLWMFGFSAWVISIFCFWLCYLNLFKKSHFLKWRQIIAIFAYIFSVSVLGTLIQDSFFQGREAEINNDWSYAQGLGGVVGDVIYTQGMRIWLGPVGTSVVLAATLLLSLILLFTSDFSNILERAQSWLVSYRERAGIRRLKRKEDKARKKAEALEASLKMSEKSVIAETKKPTAGKIKLREENGEESILEPIELEDVEELIVPQASNPATPVESVPTIAIRPPRAGFSKPEDSNTPLKIVETQTTRKALKKSVPLRHGNYIFPTLALLQDPPERDHELDKSEHEATAAALIQTLANFKVTVRMGEVHTGPVITRYEVRPAPGVKVGKILGLENDIALGLKALAVRIQAPVPGKGTVGIEVPNKRPEAVYLRDIIESEDWANSTAEIPIALGKEVSGRPLIADLTKMPHLLVAGATGSGKTVCINAIIASLVYHSSPEDIRFIMVDPKIVEMQVFNDLPHMMIPVVTDPKKVPGALKWLIGEMERRYQIFAKMGVRNIASFNDKQKATRKEANERKAQSAIDGMAREDLLGMDNIPEAEAPYIEVPRDEEVLIPEKFPYIVCIIDELADLMMVAQQDIEVGIARLAQLARAAGIHLIIATQRPSVNVITGIIKANLPSRIAFQVSSKVDSRTILDESGAEQLIGRGDMLFNPPGSGKLLRSQGCFVSDDEINNIVEFLKQNGPPQFVEEVQRQIESEDYEDIEELQEEEDNLFPAAIDVLRGTGRASTSMLQRRLKIGYNRAARIMDLMEARGIVGPDNGSKPRDIIMDLENL
jgi:DNA segregation ATPase FtsK/SpoIIIE, S-DNA-T family